MSLHIIPIRIVLSCLTLLVFLILLSLCFPSLYAEHLTAHPASEAVILMNADTGAILYEKNARTSYFPASITKIATALYALNKKKASLEDVVIAEQESVASVTSEQKRRSNFKLPSYWLEVGGTHIGIKTGEKLTLRDLLYGLMISSGNDAANVIGQHVSGTIPGFMSEVNAYLKTLGCKNTNFLNPHGLHHPDHKTTPYDMAIMTCEALKDPTFREIVSTVRYTRPKTNKQEPTTLVQTNKLLRSGQFHYPKAIGVKTGHHSAAQNTFVGAAQHEGRTLIVVLMHTKERSDIFKDAINLFDEAFKQSKVQRILMKSGPQKYILKLDGSSEPVKTFLKEDLILEYYPAEEPQVKAMIFWDDVKLPISKNQRVGELRLTSRDGKMIMKTLPVYSQNDVKSSWLHKMSSLVGVISQASTFLKWSMVVLVMGLLTGFALIFRRR